MQTGPRHFAWEGNFPIRFFRYKKRPPSIDRERAKYTFACFYCGCVRKMPSVRILFFSFPIILRTSFQVFAYRRKVTITAFARNVNRGKYEDGKGFTASPFFFPFPHL